MTAASFRLFGITEWTARLAQALSVLALLLVLFRAAVIFQIFAKGRQFLKPDEPKGS